MKKNEIKDDEYVEAYPPNIFRLSKYLKLAKGENRTMAEFAKDCKTVSAPTLSRIVNGKITKPLPVELIDTIIENAADKESVNRDDFLRANGMVPKKEWEIRKNAAANFEERIKIQEDIKHIIADELYSRGCMLRIYPGLPREELPESGFLLPQQSGKLAVSIHGYEPKFWNFFVFIPFDYLDSTLDENRLMINSMRDAVGNWSLTFLRDAWEPETLKDVKHSFVFTNKQYYDAFCGIIMKAKMNSYMSVILIDIAKQRVVEEKMIPRHDGEVPSSVFDMKKLF